MLLERLSGVDTSSTRRSLREQGDIAWVLGYERAAGRKRPSEVVKARIRKPVAMARTQRVQVEAYAFVHGMPGDMVREH